MVKMPTSMRVSPSDASGNTLVQARRQTFDVGNGTSKQWPGLLKVVIGLSIGQIFLITVIAAVLGSFVSSHGIEIDRLKTISEKVDEAISSNIHQMAMVQLLNDSINDRLSLIEIDLNWQATVIDQIKVNCDDGNGTTYDQSARIDILETKLEINQRIISNHTDTIEVIQKQSHAQNPNIERISDKVVEMESVIAADQYVSVNNTDKIKQLEEILNEQNTSIVRIDKKISNLQIDQQFDQNSFKELTENVFILEANVTADAIMLKNLSSHLKVIDHEMSLVADMVYIQQDNQEQLKENMTALSIDFINFHYNLNDLEARTNASELSWLQNENRMEKLELSHSLETVLNEEQEATINKIEEELNKTVAVMQDFIKGAAESKDKMSAFSIYCAKATQDTTTYVLRFSSDVHSQILNIGGHYDMLTGVFTCEHRGIYVFVLNLYRLDESGNKVQCYIRKNSSNIAAATVPAYSEDGINSSSGSAVVHLEPGDTVSVGECVGTDNISCYTTFIGFLLQAA